MVKKIWKTIITVIQILSKGYKIPQEDLWRIFRIMSEFVEGFEGMSKIKPSVLILAQQEQNQMTNIINLQLMLQSN